MFPFIFTMVDRKLALKGTLLLAALLALLPFAAADSYSLFCLGEGETLNLQELCNPAMENRDGPINICMHLLDNGKKCPAPLNTCNGLGLTCESTGTNTTLDTTPPIMTLNSPQEGSVFTERAVLVDLNVNEKSDVYYQKASDTRRWTRVCTDCTSYGGKRTFDEGLNEITFRVTDRADNEAFVMVSFFVDSKAPKITSVMPNGGLASGTFAVEFQEGSPENLEVMYGNVQTGMRTYNVDLLSECTANGDSYSCEFDIDLMDYDGETISYTVELEDVAGNMVTSSPVNLLVDYSDPMISLVNYTVDGKNVLFRIGIEEPSFAKATYIEHTASNPKESTLCTKLVNDVCEKKVSFNSDGEHDVEIIVYDTAGNTDSTLVEGIFTDSKKPTIKSVAPTKGFASGTFDMSFDEANPVSLVLNYGNDESGMKQTNIDLNSCGFDGKYTACSVDVSLSDYDGEIVDYEFVLTDRAGQSVSKGASKLAVDLAFPVIDYLDHAVDGKNVLFDIGITESNLEEVTLLDMDDPNGREKRLCTTLKEDVCSKKVSFKDGEHTVVITVRDKAGRSSSESVSFFTDSKKPKTKSVSPDRDFADGEFIVQFEESNPVELVLEYGTSDKVTVREKEIDLDDCSLSGKYHTCSVDVDLSEFDGEEIYYFFTLRDRAEQVAVKGAEGLMVDLSFPVIESLTYEMIGTQALVMIEVDEQNLDKIVWVNNADGRPRENTFCTKLADGACSKKIRLNSGENPISFIVYDEAGNSAGQSLVITR